MFVLIQTLKNVIINLVINRSYAVVPLPDFWKIGSFAEIREVGIEIIIQK